MKLVNGGDTTVVDAYLSPILRRYVDGVAAALAGISADATKLEFMKSDGGLLTVTDCNVLVGKIQPAFFPQVFGTEGNLPIDLEIVRSKFAQLTTGFVAIAIDKMAKAIAKISVQRGYDASEYTLCCFGGAGGQHACAIAESLGMSQIFIHPYAGVLSAYGIGLADVRVLKERAVEALLTEETLPNLEQILAALTIASQAEIIAQGTSEDRLEVVYKAHLRYEGTDSTLTIEFGSVEQMRSRFDLAYLQRYSFTMLDKALIVESVPVEAIGHANAIAEPVLTAHRTTPCLPVATVPVYTHGDWHQTPVYQRAEMPPNSTHIDEEGILLDNFKLVDRGHFRESELLEILGSGNYPVRNPAQNLADLQAQIAANERGVRELHRTIEHYGLATVQTYMQHVRNNAAESVRRAISVLQDGSYTYIMDDGTEICVNITIDRTQRSARIDFTGTSPQQPT